jgi:hypothetical protein
MQPRYNFEASEDPINSSTNRNQESRIVDNQLRHVGVNVQPIFLKAVYTVFLLPSWGNGLKIEPPISDNCKV